MESKTEGDEVKMMKLSSSWDRHMNLNYSQHILPVHNTVCMCVLTLLRKSEIYEK